MGSYFFFNHNGESKAIVCELVGSLTSRFCVLGIEERKKKKRGEVQTCGWAEGGNLSFMT